MSSIPQVARAMQAVLQEEKLASGIQVVNVPGGGGTVGLAQYITARKRSPSVLAIGFALVGGILTTKAPVTLEQTQPLARLVGEQDLLVVPANSDIKTLADLVGKLKADPGAVSWGGGSIGGFDHVLVGLIAKAVGVDPMKANYIVHAGGGEVLASVLGGHVTVGVSGYNEFAEQVRSGDLRALAVSGADRMPELDIPTLRDGGVDVAMVNWRGLMAPAKVRSGDLEELSQTAMLRIDAPDEFALIETERQRVIRLARARLPHGFLPRQDDRQAIEVGDDAPIDGLV